MKSIIDTMNKFPLSIAVGKAFCNRKQELDILQAWLLQKRPVLMMSPRRYGKTSLALNAIKKTGLPYAHIDLFSVVDEEDIERVILSAVASLISQIGTTAQKALALANKIFGGTQIRVALTKVGIEVELKHNEKKTAYRILDVLKRLDHLAEHVGKPIILFFDEFQAVGEVVSDHGIEAVLRQVAQLNESMSFIFSGSHRHLLRQMFEDRHRPLYKLCEKMTLERISEAEYIKHIERISKERWGTPIATETVKAICFYSERHPYYVNVICSRMLLGKKPSPEDIQTLWDQYVIEERSNVAAEVDLLSVNQKKLLTILARENGHQALSGKEFVKKANMSKATIVQAHDFLERKDYVYKDEEGVIRVLDPLIKAVLSK